MTKPEIYNHLNKNIPFRYFNAKYTWTDWHVFKPESLVYLQEIAEEHKSEFELQIRDNRYRLFIKLKQKNIG